MERTAIEIKKISIKNYLNEVSFNAFAGQIVGILTKNDDISTTLFDILAGKKKLNDGKIFYFNHNIKKEKKYLLNFVGFMPYNQITFSKKTIKDYFAYSASFYQGDFYTNINNLLERFNLNSDTLIEDLNKEQTSIISFIDSVFFEPEVLILNSPFKNASVSTIKKMSIILSDFKQRGYCVVIIQSSFDGIIICDNTYIVENQNIIEYEAYKKTKSYKKIYLELTNEEDLKYILGLSLKTLYQNDLKISFIYKDDVNSLVKSLNKLNIIDIKIEDPSLDEVDDGI